MALRQPAAALVSISPSPHGRQDRACRRTARAMSPYISERFGRSRRISRANRRHYPGIRGHFRFRAGVCGHRGAGKPLSGFERPAGGSGPRKRKQDSSTRWRKRPPEFSMTSRQATTSSRLLPVPDVSGTVRRLAIRRAPVMTSPRDWARSMRRTLRLGGVAPRTRFFS